MDDLASLVYDKIQESAKATAQACAIYVDFQFEKFTGLKKDRQVVCIKKRDDGTFTFNWKEQETKYNVIVKTLQCACDLIITRIQDIEDESWGMELETDWWRVKRMSVSVEYQKSKNDVIGITLFKWTTDMDVRVGHFCDERLHQHVKRAAHVAWSGFVSAHEDGTELPDRIIFETDEAALF